MHLYQILQQQVDQWRKNGYAHAEYPVIAEILEWAATPSGDGFRLRPPQVRALETYWYLRMREETPHIMDLYQHLFPKKSELLEALGLNHPDIRTYVMDYEMEGLFTRIKTDDPFVKKYQLQAVRETLALEYPSYILALAMGAGKTILIGAIFATEFAMALEYPEGPFVQNALIFAPGKTIIESLRELAETPYQRIIPPRLYKPFAASLKLIFTRDGDPDIPVIPGSIFNVIVTNTEKIRIQKETVRKSEIGKLLAPEKEEEAKAEIANRRLRAIASLPHLAVFSDEAHHTYGQSLETGLKKVRKTVDYLAQNTNVICVINTTGTPYFRRQPLRDVVIWYGLSEGIRDGILKEVAGNIQAFDFQGRVDAYLQHVIEDFFRDYGGIALPNGIPAKLAIYFPQTDDVEELRPVIEAKLAELGLPPTILLEHHTQNERKEEFDRFKFKDSPHRVALLVDRGTEGWDVPALFACALARKLKSSNNFVLQAASRCLRQVPGNSAPARIYLSVDNRSILDRQLQETYGETISDLNHAQNKSRRVEIKVRKVNIPPIAIKRRVRTVVKKETAETPLILLKPTPETEAALQKTTYTVAEQKSGYGVLQQLGDTVVIASPPRQIDLYSAAQELAATYRLDFWAVYDPLRQIYGSEGEILLTHLEELQQQIEQQTRQYEVREETVEDALALIKTDGFSKSLDESGAEVYTAEISYPVDREKLLTRWEEWKEKAGEIAFHYTPYNFDSQPEQNFFEQLLNELQQPAHRVSDIYFTGALTDPNKTDFYVEYKGTDGKWHRYSPDFVIRLKNGKCLIVEIKKEHDREHPIDGENGAKAVATRQMAGLNPKRLKYQMVFTQKESIPYEQLNSVRQFMKGEDSNG